MAFNRRAFNAKGHCYLRHPLEKFWYILRVFLRAMTTIIKSHVPQKREVIKKLFL